MRRKLSTLFSDRLSCKTTTLRSHPTELSPIEEDPPSHSKPHRYGKPLVWPDRRTYASSRILGLYDSIKEIGSVPASIKLSPMTITSITSSFQSLETHYATTKARKSRLVSSPHPQIDPLPTEEEPHSEDPCDVSGTGQRGRDSPTDQVSHSFGAPSDMINRPRPIKGPKGSVLLLRSGRTGESVQDLFDRLQAESNYAPIFAGLESNTSTAIPGDNNTPSLCSAHETATWDANPDASPSHGWSDSGQVVVPTATSKRSAWFGRFGFKSRPHHPTSAKSGEPGHTVDSPEGSGRRRTRYSGLFGATRRDEQPRFSGSDERNENCVSLGISRCIKLFRRPADAWDRGRARERMNNYRKSGVAMYEGV